MPLIIGAIALLSTGVSALLAGRSVVLETGNQVNKTGPMLVALAVAGVALVLVLKKKGK